LIKQVQRICKYPLLLKELIKKTDATLPEFSKLQEAYIKIEDIVSQINEKKRESEGNQRALEISVLLINADNYNLVTPTRRFVAEGELQHYSSQMKLKPGYYFLFNDLFMYTKKKGKNFIVKASASLDKAAIRYVSTYDKPTFELIHPELGKAWPLVVETEEEKIKLMEDLQYQIDKKFYMGCRWRI